MWRNFRLMWGAQMGNILGEAARASILLSCQKCRRLRFGNASRQHRVNWAVNKAGKLGLEVRDADTEEDLPRGIGSTC